MWTRLCEECQDFRAKVAELKGERAAGIHSDGLPWVRWGCGDECDNGIERCALTNRVVCIAFPVPTSVALSSKFSSDIDCSLKQSVSDALASALAKQAAMADVTVLVPIADDSEEIETACITDTLVRAGAQVTVASVSGNLQCKMSRGLKIVADCLIDDCKDKEWSAIALPGGMPGAERLRDCATLVDMLKKQSSEEKVTAAVCASPAVVFGTHGLLPSKSTCYPAQKFKDVVGEGWQDAQAVIDGHIITSQGPGTSLQFALKIVEKLFGEEKAMDIAKAMLTTTI